MINEDGRTYGSMSNDFGAAEAPPFSRFEERILSEFASLNCSLRAFREDTLRKLEHLDQTMLEQGARLARLEKLLG